jgi:arylsulfatase A-like enzyme
MISGSGASAGEGTIEPESAGLGARRPGFIAYIFLVAWCGLVAGLLEVGTTVVRKQAFDPNPFYRISRHFVWIVPLTNVCLFLAIGLLVYLTALAWPRRGQWLGARLICALVLLPAMFVAFERFYALASFIFTLGVAMRLVPLFERNPGGLKRLVRISFPVLVLTIMILAASIWIGDGIKQYRENARALPPPGAANVLLIVMDTVAAKHLSLHGYGRETSTTLAELAERAIQFDSAQAASSWTLPSHATMFTGRWMHELSAGWFTQLDDAHPTVAEYLGKKGYATAGFVANMGFCGTDSGLGRGFTRYHDFIFPGFTFLKLSTLVSRALLGIESLVSFLDDQQDFVRAKPYVEEQIARVLFDRKSAAAVNRELLEWLARRPQTERPFFAFLNYFDAHSPYHLPPGRIRRFGSAPADSFQHELIETWGYCGKAGLSPQDVAFVSDAYDDCVSDLDEQLGTLVDELDRRGVLERTWLIITADHGESFGEHTGIFLHGTSLYQTELHIPLLILSPGGRVIKRAITETVSLRDLAATIVDVLDLESGSPFPGDSLGRYWNGPAADPPTPAEPALSEVVPDDPRIRETSGWTNKHWPLGALNGGGWTYIRREGDVSEELFHLSIDPKEQANLVGEPSARAMLEQRRDALRRQTNGPLLPDRFNP